MVLLDRESAASDSTDLCCHGDRQWLCRFVSVQHVRWIVSGDSCRYLAAALSELSAKNRRCEIHNIDRTVTGRYSLIKWQGDIQILFRNCCFLLKISSKTDKKTELGWDYRTAVIGKKASALPCFASLFSSLGMSYTWNIWHTYSFDIYYIFSFLQ